MSTTKTKQRSYGKDVPMLVISIWTVMKVGTMKEKKLLLQRLKLLKQTIRYNYTFMLTLLCSYNYTFVFTLLYSYNYTYDCRILAVASLSKKLQKSLISFV